jgi:hypothetical protein
MTIKSSFNYWYSLGSLSTLFSFTSIVWASYDCDCLWGQHFVSNQPEIWKSFQCVHVIHCSMWIEEWDFSRDHALFPWAGPLCLVLNNHIHVAWTLFSWYLLLKVRTTSIAFHLHVFILLSFFFIEFPLCLNI